MNAAVREQIMAVRDTGETNMLDTRTVQVIANRMGFYELVIYLEEHKREYVNFILTGETGEVRGMYAHYAVGVPAWKLSQEEFDRLLEIIAHNTELLKKALGTDSLAVVVLLDRLWFPWFTPQGLSGEIDTYHALVSRLCAQAKSPDYQHQKTHQGSASKFAMWLFLLKFGFAGRHQRTGRKLLLRNF